MGPGRVTVAQPASEAAGHGPGRTRTIWHHFHRDSFQLLASCRGTRGGDGGRSGGKQNVAAADPDSESAGAAGVRQAQRAALRVCRWDFGSSCEAAAAHRQIRRALRAGRVLFSFNLTPDSESPQVPQCAMEATRTTRQLQS